MRGGTGVKYFLTVGKIKNYNLDIQVKIDLHTHELPSNNVYMN